MFESPLRVQGIPMYERVNDRESFCNHSQSKRGRKTLFETLAGPYDNGRAEKARCEAIMRQFEIVNCSNATWIKSTKYAYSTSE